MKIRGNLDEMKRYSDSYKNKAEEVSRINQEMQSFLIQIQEEWEGRGCQAFAERYAELKPAFEKSAALINDISVALSKSADALKEGDEIASRTFGGR